MDKLDNSVNVTRVAIISESEDRRLSLKKILEVNGARVTWDAAYKKYDCKQLVEESDVLLVDLDDSSEQEMYFIDQLIEDSSLPILFNDSAMQFNGGIQDDWGRKLVEKLGLLAHPKQSGSTSTTPDNVLKTTQPKKETKSTLTEHPVKVSPCAHLSEYAAKHVWVLGASIGGPQSLKRFLAGLPADIEMGFVLVQHIGANFVPLLAEQLNRVTKLKVLCAEHDSLIQNGQVVLVPTEKHFTVKPNGQIDLQELTQRYTYNPSIDAVMLEIAHGYGESSGGILFSGMGNDGLRGAREIVEYGGIIWAQDAQTCIISSMVDYACQAGLVELSGTPEELCASLVEYSQRLNILSNDEYTIRG